MKQEILQMMVRNGNARILLMNRRSRSISPLKIASLKNVLKQRETWWNDQCKELEENDLNPLRKK